MDEGGRERGSPLPKRGGLTSGGRGGMMSLMLPPTSRRHSMATPHPASSTAGQGAGVGTVGRPYSPAPGEGRAGKKEEGGEETGNVHVVLRIRPSFPAPTSIPLRFQRVVLSPLSSQEVSIQLHSDLPASSSFAAGAAGPAVGGGAGGGNAKKGQTFVYDTVLGEEAGQEVVYSASAREGVERFVAGVNVTIFAYGQTSSGKSYTMGTTGDDKDYLPSSPPSLPPSRIPSCTEDSDDLISPPSSPDSSRVGIIPRAVQEIFERVEEARRRGGGVGGGWECRLSFLELYNEDLIDLLSPLPASQSPPITIREDTRGRILWSGLRELKVTSVSEVMSYLRQGSARRVKGETGMNKESSRSHAIMSLSLVQRRRQGGVPLGAGEAGKVKRPMSYSGIPTPGGTRSPTPTGGRPGSRTSMIPPSSMRAPGTPTNGRVGAFSPTMGQEEDNPFSAGGALVEIASKFHFVDLAGSERIKKTAATGERMKEGIAINSGLTALGNVISALGDPNRAQSRGGVGVHVPYRDSKLTRLLQDSLGGNSYTVMIANVSPLEYNLSETLNTLKYAARARNIKNKAEVNEVELGWDDVEHLQSTVKKLRVELGVLKKGGVGDGGGVGEEDGEGLRTARVRLAELQAEHDDLESVFKETNLKLARTAAELEESRQVRSANGTRPVSTTKFAELVDPIIREYEQTISSLEAEVQRIKAAWQYSNELANEQETKLSSAERLKEQQNEYIGTLKVRIQKLSDRDATSEAHIADLEASLKTYSEREDANATTVLELRKDLAKHKELETNTAHYIAQLEAGGVKSEEQITALTAKVEKLENEVTRKEELYEKLEARVKLLDTSQDNKVLLEELDQKDHQIADTERKLEEALAECTAMARERDRLREISQTQASAASSMMAQSTISVDGVVTPSGTEETLTGSRSHITQIGNATKQEEENSELVELRATHAETLVELDIVTVQYRDSLREITELTTQLDELKLVSSETKDVVPDSPVASLAAVSESGDPATPSVTTSPRIGARRRGTGRLSLTTGGTGAGGVNGLGFQSGRGGSNQSHSRQLSLSQELSSSELSPSTWADSGSLLSPNAAHRQSLPLLKPQRSIQSLETEIKQLQNVLKLRDEEITQLEERLRSTNGIPSRQSNADIKTAKTSSGSDEDPTSLSSHGDPYGTSTSPSTPESEHQMLTPVTPIRDRSASSFTENSLSPQMKQQIDDLRLSLNGAGGADSARVDELMRSMARKETAHREEVEALRAELSGFRRSTGVLTPDTEKNIGLGFSSVIGVEQSSVLPNGKAVTGDADRSREAAAVELKAKYEAELEKMKHHHAQEVMRLSTEFDAVVKTSMDMKATIREKETLATKAIESARSQEETLTSLQQELQQLASVYEPFAEIKGASVTKALRSALEKGLSDKQLLVQHSAQLKARTVELQDTKQTLEAIAADKAAKEATIQALENRIQELAAKAAEDEANANSQMTRLSLARAATPSGGAKYPPPITPPPSIPPPPVPSAIPAVPPISDSRKSGDRDRGSVSTTASGAGSSSSHHGMMVEGGVSESRLIAQVEEQENIIRTLNKQLLHCETDLQASMDLVSTLEQNLNTSERNLRRARTQMQENVKERDATSSEIARLRSELDAAQVEIKTVRSSVISEKRSLEDRLSEERKAKEKARALLEQRLQEATAQKANSKFRCF